MDHGISMDTGTGAVRPAYSVRPHPCERKKILVLLQGGYVDGGYVDDDGGNGNDDACCTGYTLSYTLFLTFIIVLIISYLL